MQQSLTLLSARRIVLVLFAALVAAIVFSPLALRSAPPKSSSEAVPDWEQVNKEAVAWLSAYIRVDTSDPPGNEIRGAQFFGNILDGEGVPYQIAESAPGRGNLVARLAASVPPDKKEPALILLSHMDVVPVSREFWTVDPFAGVIKDGYLWGRGAIDMKSIGLAEFEAFLELKRLGVPLRRDVIFLATADEEAGGNFGAGWVVKERPQWTEGAGFVLTEGARSPATPEGKPRYYGVGPSEKTPCWLKLTAKGRSGHASIPIPDSAPNRLVAALDKLRTYRPPLELTPPIDAAFQSLAPYEPEPWHSRFADPPAFLRTPGAYDELSKRPAILALLTNTLSITGLEGSPKINIIPPVATALVDCRLLPGWTAARWVAEVRRIVADDSIQVDVVLNFPPTASSTDTLLYRAIEHSVAALHPGVGIALSVSSGFTDSHFFRERGIVAYGFSPFALLDADSDRMHGTDERIPVAAYTDGVRLLWDVVYDFCRAGS